MSDAMQDSEHEQRKRWEVDPAPVSMTIAQGSSAIKEAGDRAMVTQQPPMQQPPFVTPRPIKGFVGIHARLQVLEDLLAQTDLNVSELVDFLNPSLHKGEKVAVVPPSPSSRVEDIIDRIGRATNYVRELNAKINMCKSEIIVE